MEEERHERIRAVVASIPPGRVASYGDVAAVAGERSARVVGTVLRTDGADLPWHRVLRADGTSAPQVAAEQHRRLREEGVAIHDGRVRWTDCRWDPRGCGFSDTECQRGPYRRAPLTADTQP